MSTDDRQVDDSAGDWLESLSDAAVETRGQGRQHEAAPAPPLDRARPERRPVIARWVWMGTLGALAGLVIILTLIAWGAARSAIPVPSVVGLDVGVARTTLRRVDLNLSIAEERFDSAPEGTVLSQTPPAGETLTSGESVEVIVSAGTEEFAMPDVVGDGLPLATGVLSDLGLAVQVERIVSDAASDTVLSSIPAAGALVRSGDSIRLVVAAPRDASVSLRPFRLDGLTFVIDPAPVPASASKDGALEVSRRLEAMLNASGAQTVLLRSALDSASPDGERSKKAAEASATACIGISVAEGTDAGRSVTVPPSTTPRIGTDSARLGAAVIAELSAAAPPVKRTESTYDPIFSAAAVPWNRVIVGSAGAREDASLFADPGWTDRVSRAIYTALGTVYGQAVTP